MADFCKQCSEELFDKDFKELADITSKIAEMENLYSIVICEGCGTIQVKNDGSCIGDCLKKEHIYE